MRKILITGGACSGKTEIIRRLFAKYTELGFNVFIINEVPTMLINNGLTSAKVGKKRFINVVIKMYLDMQKNYEWAITSSTDECLLIVDGSPIDMLKFIEKDELEKILKDYDTSIEKYLNCFDKIVFLDSIAVEHPEMFTTDNNKARINDVQQAIIRNNILKSFYLDKADVLGYFKTVDEKVDKVMKIIN